MRQGVAADAWDGPFEALQLRCVISHRRQGLVPKNRDLDRRCV
jgi:hypothetical protein